MNQTITQLEKELASAEEYMNRQHAILESHLRSVDGEYLLNNINASRTDYAACVKRLEEAKKAAEPRNYEMELRKLVEESAKADGEDIATQISILVELAGFDYQVYVDLPGYFEEVLETASARRHEQMMYHEALEEFGEDEEVDTDEDAY